jgi:hypothetical protein
MDRSPDYRLWVGGNVVCDPVTRSHREQVRFVPQGLNESSPTPQGLRRGRSGWCCRPPGFGCAVVCEGDLAHSAWVADRSDPSRRERCEPGAPFVHHTGAVSHAN